MKRIVLERDISEVPPPTTVITEAVPKIVLFTADGTPLGRQIGFVKGEK